MTDRHCDTPERSACGHQPADGALDARFLNAVCACFRPDPDAAADAFAGLSEATRAALRSRPQFFAPEVAFVDHAVVERIVAFLAAMERLVARPEWQRSALADAPPSARPSAAAGVMMGYDFHLGPDGPKLIEINTNAGGAALQVLALAAVRACCRAAELWREETLRLPYTVESARAALIQSFAEDYAAARSGSSLTHLAIVDQEPQRQALFPEFLVYADWFRAHGWTVEILDPSALTLRDDGVHGAEGRIELIYNRLTDFGLEWPSHAVLAAAHREDRVVLTPHPRVHALYADKRRLIELCDARKLRALGVDASDAATIVGMVPETRAVAEFDPARLWAERAQWFFKPARGYGSKAAYRGDKLTRGHFQDILAQATDYVAQRVVPPSTRHARLGAGQQVLKWDLRAYAYRGRLLLLGARLYQGQTTNFRTPGGGFAPVWVV